jgi:DNA-binding sugar fermentation-stimulating protein
MTAPSRRSWRKRPLRLRLERGDARCYVEVKSVTLSRAMGLGAFPDAKAIVPVVT